MSGSHEQELQHSQAANERAKSGRSNSAASYGVVDAGRALETFGELTAGGAFENERHKQSKRQKVEAEGQTDTSAAPKAVVMRASASIQGAHGSEHGKDVIASSRGAAQVEDGTEAQPRSARSLDIQGAPLLLLDLCYDLAAAHSSFLIAERVSFVIYYIFACAHALHMNDLHGKAPKLTCVPSSRPRADFAVLLYQTRSHSIA